MEQIYRIQYVTYWSGGIYRSQGTYRVEHALRRHCEKNAINISFFYTCFHTENLQLMSAASGVGFHNLYPNIQHFYITPARIARNHR